MILVNLAISFLNMIKVKSLECMSVVNQKCMSKPKILDVNPNEPVFYPYSIKVNKCSGSCNNVNDPFAKLCVPDITKNSNLKVFNLMARINETRQIVWHETCKCICKLTSAVCNSRQIWNEDKCRCECKEDLINKMVCDKGYIWNPSNCACDCDKLCDIGQYLDYKNCVCRKSIVDKLVEESINVIDGDTMYNDINIYYIGYVTKKTEYNINSVNPLYLFISILDGFIDEKNCNKYLNITLADRNNDALIKYAEVWNGIINQIKKINNDSIVEYDKDYMKF